jgi:histidine kinase
MATGVAHELNQPLSVIKMASSFFIRKIEKNESVQDETLHGMLKKIDGNVDRATRIIEHMRQFARKSDLRLEKVQLNDVLGRAFEIFSQQLRLRGIEVIWDLDPELPRILADASRLEQVFINLLLNARDAIEEKWTEPEAIPGNKAIILKTMRNRHKVICEVRDTGKGVSPALAEKIFEPFFTTKEVGKGTGLGLSISYGIVQECGGTIRVDRDSTTGACFVLEFPIPEKHNGAKNPHRR